VNGVECIDGILIWMQKPTKKDWRLVYEEDLFCGRKHKFGLTMQATCNSQKQFLDVSINYGAALSDHMAFEVSDLRRKLLA